MRTGREITNFSVNPYILEIAEAIDSNLKEILEVWGPIIGDIQECAESGTKLTVHELLFIDKFNELQAKLEGK